VPACRGAHQREPRSFISLRELPTAARVQLAADDREASARRRSSEVTAEVLSEGSIA